MRLQAGMSILDRVPHSPRDLLAGQTCLAFPRTWTKTCKSGRGRLKSGLRSAVDLAFAQHPVASLSQVPSYGDDGTSVTLGRMQPLVEQPDMALPVNPNRSLIASACKP